MSVSRGPATTLYFVPLSLAPYEFILVFYIGGFAMSFLKFRWVHAVVLLFDGV